VAQHFNKTLGFYVTGADFSLCDWLLPQVNNFGPSIWKDILALHVAQRNA